MFDKCRSLGRILIFHTVFGSPYLVIISPKENFVLETRMGNLNAERTIKIDKGTLLASTRQVVRK